MAPGSYGEGGGSSPGSESEGSGGLDPLDDGSIGDAGLNGMLLYNFMGSEYFHWSDYSLDELLNFAAEDEVTFLGVTSLGGGPGQSGPLPAGNLASLISQILTKLLQDPECLSFLGRNDPHALDTIANTPVTVGDASSDPDTPAVTSFTISPKSPVPTSATIIMINQNSTFFNGGQTAHFSGASTLYQTGSSEFQAVVLLHEFGHATGALLQNDNSVATSEQENNRAIDAHCDKTISSFSGGSN